MNPTDVYSHAIKRTLADLYGVARPERRRPQFLTIEFVRGPAGRPSPAAGMRSPRRRSSLKLPRKRDHSLATGALPRL